MVLSQVRMQHIFISALYVGSASAVACCLPNTHACTLRIFQLDTTHSTYTAVAASQASADESSVAAVLCCSCVQSWVLVSCSLPR
jgi:hypothetical protein